MIARLLNRRLNLLQLSMYVLKHKGQVATYSANVYNIKSNYSVHLKRLNKIQKIHKYTHIIKN